MLFVSLMNCEQLLIPWLLLTVYLYFPPESKKSEVGSLELEQDVTFIFLDEYYDVFFGEMNKYINSILAQALSKYNISDTCT